MTVAKGELITYSDVANCTFFPKGTILMYDGGDWVDNQTLPGWYRCDGQDTPYGKTPDLRDRFICGGETSGEYGGNIEHSITKKNMPRHAHVFSGEISATRKEDTVTVTDLVGYLGYGAHAMSEVGTSGIVSVDTNYARGVGSGDTGFGGAYRFYIDLNHSHGFSEDDFFTGYMGEGQSFKVNAEPAYYALIYIKKMV
jgi:hypothetical protein